MVSGNESVNADIEYVSVWLSLAVAAEKVTLPDGAGWDSDALRSSVRRFVGVISRDTVAFGDGLAESDGDSDSDAEALGVCDRDGALRDRVGSDEGEPSVGERLALRTALSVTVADVAEAETVSECCKDRVRSVGDAVGMPDAETVIEPDGVGGGVSVAVLDAVPAALSLALGAPVTVGVPGFVRVDVRLTVAVAVTVTYSVGVFVWVAVPVLGGHVMVSERVVVFVSSTVTVPLVTVLVEVREDCTVSVSDRVRDTSADCRRV